jgi:glycosyltransferase involved in cell wall biosynthesis
MNELYNHSKIKTGVFLFKGEGFGRILLEFTQSKKPIIASGWSGPIDFLHKDFTTLLPGNLTNIHPSAQVKDMLIEGSQWFTVDLGAAGGYMKDYFENYSKYKDNGKRLGYYCKENFTFEKMKELQKQVIDKYNLEPFNLVLPKLQKIK